MYKRQVKNKAVKFDITRNATRVYFDEKLFPYQNKGGALENWLCNDNKHKQFEVTSMKAEGTKLTITLKSNCYYWNNYGEDRTEKPVSYTHLLSQSEKKIPMI